MIAEERGSDKEKKERTTTDSRKQKEEEIHGENQADKSKR